MNEEKRTDIAGNCSVPLGRLVKRFDDWWAESWKIFFWTRWFEPLVRPIAKSAFECGRIAERRMIIADIQGMIKQGDIQGNGCDETAQRNGMVLSINKIFKRDEDLDT